MNSRILTLPYCLAAITCGTLIAFGLQASSTTPAQPLAPFHFHREAASSPEDAAKALCKGIAAESPSDFVNHLLLGVCDGSIDTLQKFAECMHETHFEDGNQSLTFYDLKKIGKGLNPKNPVRVVGSMPFSSEDPDVQALGSEMLSTYYAERFVAVDVISESYDGREYRTRIVAAMVDDGWYAMPRCRSSSSFYKVADAMD